MIQIKVSNICTVTNCPDKIINIAKQVLSIKNPAYQKITRITGNSWAAQRDFKYYSIPKGSTGTINFPRGFFKRFVAYMDKMNISYEAIFDFVHDKTKDTINWPPVTLRDYQIPLVKDILCSTEGIVDVGTGSGKTVLACEITRLLGLKTLIIVPTTAIQSQFIDEFKKWFDYSAGVINATNKTIKDITVTTWQSLSADMALVDKLAGQTAMLIIDEAQGVISTERSSILKKFKPSRIFGLSATPRRSREDGRTEAIFFYIGGVCATYHATQIVPTVEVINTREDIPVSYNYADMVENMINNESRNALICGIAAGETMEGHKTLILCKRRTHCDKLLGALKHLGVYYADSDDKTRNKELLAMRAGTREFSILIGTTSLLSAGVDIPSLDVVIICCDLKSDVLVQQSAGRILRFFESKESAKIYDLYDGKNPIFMKQFKERLSFYKSQKWEIKGLENWKK